MLTLALGSVTGRVEGGGRVGEEGGEKDGDGGGGGERP